MPHITYISYLYRVFGPRGPLPGPTMKYRQLFFLVPKKTIRSMIWPPPLTLRAWGGSILLRETGFNGTGELRRRLCTLKMYFITFMIFNSYRGGNPWTLVRPIANAVSFTLPRFRSPLNLVGTWGGGRISPYDIDRRWRRMYYKAVSHMRIIRRTLNPLQSNGGSIITKLSVNTN